MPRGIPKAKTQSIEGLFSTSLNEMEPTGVFEQLNSSEKTYEEDEEMMVERHKLTLKYNLYQSTFPSLNMENINNCWTVDDLNRKLSFYKKINNISTNDSLNINKNIMDIISNLLEYCLSMVVECDNLANDLKKNENLDKLLKELSLDMCISISFISAEKKFALTVLYLTVKNILNNQQNKATLNLAKSKELERKLKLQEMEDRLKQEHDTQQNQPENVAENIIVENIE